MTGRAAVPTRRRRSPGLAILLTFLGLYLATASREVLWGDSKAVYLVAENFLRFDRIDIGYPWPDGAPPAADGKYYSVYPALPSVVQLPGAKLQLLLRKHWPQADPFTVPLTTHLSCALLAALTCVFFYRLCRGLGVAPRLAGGATLVLGTATLLWPYAHDPFSEALQVTCFTALFGELLDVADGRARGLALGLWAGCLVNSKLLFALTLPGAGVYLIWQLHGDRRRLLRVLGFAAAGFAPFAALFFGYTRWRFGSFVEPAVGQNESFFREHFVLGLWGFLASLGKSVFRYSPPLLVSLLGVPRLWRGHRKLAVAMLLTAAPVLVVYAKYSMWPGDHAWGPRYLIFLHPVLLLPAVLFVAERAQEGLRRWHKAALGLVFALGVGTQLLGIAFWRGHWIRISRDVSRAWLGVPNRTGSLGFEELYGRAWLPPFDPIAGHLWLLRHHLAGDDARTAERDAPWRRYTTLELLPADVWNGLRFDWWPILWIDDHPEYQTAGLVLLASELALLGAGAAWWWRRRDEGAPP